jgi:AraC-like DNA-binding protein
LLEVMTLAHTATQIHRPLRSHAEVSDPAELHEFLDRVYGAKLRLSRNGSASRDGSPLLTHARTDVGPFAIDEIHLPGDVEASPDPLNKVVGVWATDGNLSGHSDGIAGSATPGEITMMSQPDLPHYSHSRDLRQIVLLLDPSWVAGVATGMPTGQSLVPIRFSSFAPVDAAARRLWQDTVSYVKDVVLADDTLATRLVLGHASRLLAAVTLSTFPNSATADPTPHDRTDHQPVLLRRAIEFIDANVARDISLADIAEAVHVTPRAVQYMFRRHLDTTPMQYLRRLRLQYAHQELLASDRMQDTVTAIAARWGFMHTGRFAVLYRQTYGQSPHTTLRG